MTAVTPLRGLGGRELSYLAAMMMACLRSHRFPRQSGLLTVLRCCSRSWRGVGRSAQRDRWRIVQIVAESDRGSSVRYDGRAVGGGVGGVEAGVCHPQSFPKELLLEIISDVAMSQPSEQLYPTSLIELSKCCRYLYHLIHHDPWRLFTLWPRTFHVRFDTGAIYRRSLHTHLDWQAVIERRCRTLYRCKSLASNPAREELLDTMDWEVIWDMISEHGKECILNRESDINHRGLR